jgi:hypothetical protein
MPISKARMPLYIKEGQEGTQHITGDRLGVTTNQGGIVSVKCVLGCLTSLLWEGRGLNTKRREELRDHVRTCNHAKCRPNPHHNIESSIPLDIRKH